MIMFIMLGDLEIDMYFYWEDFDSIVWLPCTGGELIYVSKEMENLMIYLRGEVGYSKDVEKGKR
jgi:hypothetical protein